MKVFITFFMTKNNLLSKRELLLHNFSLKCYKSKEIKNRCTSYSTFTFHEVHVWVYEDFLARYYRCYRNFLKDLTIHTFGTTEYNNILIKKRSRVYTIYGEKYYGLKTFYENYKAISHILRILLVLPFVLYQFRRRICCRTGDYSKNVIKVCNSKMNFGKSVYLPSFFF